MDKNNSIAYYHLPGLFEFYELYKLFIPLFYNHREYFYDWCQIGSVYGAPSDCIWGGGRIENCDADASDVLDLMREYNISARLTFSNSLITKELLGDAKCNNLCRLFSENTANANGIIVHSDLLLQYIKEKYPNLYAVSSTTKVITDSNALINELSNDDFSYVVPDFRFNKSFDLLGQLPLNLRKKAEFLCNECCYYGCNSRKACYESVSRKILGESDNFVCSAPNAGNTYSFSEAMNNPGFIGVNDITSVYLPMGYINFKIEGRSLGSALILEFLLYYMVKPEYQIHVREHIYLDNMLDLF